MIRRDFISKTFSLLLLFKPSLLSKNLFSKKNTKTVCVLVLCEQLHENNIFSDIGSFFNHFHDPELSKLSSKLQKKGLLNIDAKLQSDGKSVLLTNTYEDIAYFEEIKNQVSNSIIDRSIRLRYTVLNIYYT